MEIPHLKNDSSATALQIPIQIQNKKIMDLIIAILMYLGVYATPADLNNKDFQTKNAKQIEQAQKMAAQGTKMDCDGIIVVGTGSM
ncbi:MAG: hypothetical protein R2847_03920 [Bacteroidia bacterium]|nr:hypothetical protein [Bacteroidota bacterium]